MINVLFVACIHWICWPQVVQINPFPYYGYDSRPVSLNINQDWCETNAQFYLREVSRVEKVDEQHPLNNYVSYTFKLGKPDIKFLPETIQCWPIRKGPR